MAKLVLALVILPLVVFAEPPAKEGRLFWVTPKWVVLTDEKFEDEKEPVFDITIRYLSVNLPQYEHHIIKGGVERALLMWQEGKSACVLPLLLSPERKKKAYFSALTMTVPLRFVFKNSLLPILRNKNSVSLKEILMDASLTGALPDKRSYGEAIDKLLEKYGKKIERVSSSEDTGTTLSMVMGGRVDYTLEYSQFVNYFNRTKKPESLLMSLPIIEARQPIVAYVACPRTPWGKKVIAEIDAQIQKLYTDPKFVENMNRLYRGRDVDPIRVQIEDFQLKRAEGPWLIW